MNRDRSRTSGLLLTIGLAGPFLAGCSREAPAPVVHQLRIATGNQSGVYYLIGRQLAEIYRTRVPGTAASIVESAGSGFNVRAIEEGTAELAFSQADVAYQATQRGPRNDGKPYTHLRTIAVLYVNAAQIVTLADSTIRTLDDLAGKRVGVGAPDSGTEVAARVILAANGLSHRIVSQPLGFEELASNIRKGVIDAGFFVSSYPIPVIAALNAATPIRLVPVTGTVVQSIRRDYPFFRPITIPAAAYAGLENAVATVGVDNLLLCRSDLPDDRVYDLTRALIESLSTLAGVHAAAASIGPDRARSAVVPLHPGAARFYRERELFR